MSQARTRASKELAQRRPTQSRKKLRRRRKESDAGCFVELTLFVCSIALTTLSLVNAQGGGGAGDGLGDLGLGNLGLGGDLGNLGGSGGGLGGE